MKKYLHDTCIEHIEDIESIRRNVFFIIDKISKLYLLFYKPKHRNFHVYPTFYMYYEDKNKILDVMIFLDAIHSALICYRYRILDIYESQKK